MVTHALGLCVMGIGITSLVGSENTLCVIVCMVAGTLLGEALRIEERLDGAGELLRSRLSRGSGGAGSRFTEGFVTAAVLYCVGSMAVMGAMEAGINHDYSILISKGVIDGVTSISFNTRSSVGGGLLGGPPDPVNTRSSVLRRRGQGLDPAVGTEMSAVGGTIILGNRRQHAGTGPGEAAGGQHACPPSSCLCSTCPAEGLLSRPAGRRLSGNFEKNPLKPPLYKGKKMCYINSARNHY